MVGVALLVAGMTRAAVVVGSRGGVGGAASAAGPTTLAIDSSVSAKCGGSVGAVCGAAFEGPPGTWPPSGNVDVIETVGSGTTTCEARKASAAAAAAMSEFVASPGGGAVNAGVGPGRGGLLPGA